MVFTMPGNLDIQSYSNKQTPARPPVTSNHVRLKLGFREPKIKRRPLLKDMNGMGNEKKMMLSHLCVHLWPLLP